MGNMQSRQIALNRLRDENVKHAQHQNGGELNTREVGVAIHIHTHRGEFTFDCLLLSLTSWLELHFFRFANVKIKKIIPHLKLNLP